MNEFLEKALKFLLGEAIGHFLFSKIFAGSGKEAARAATQVVAQEAVVVMRDESRIEAMVLHRVGTLYAMEEGALRAFFGQWQGRAQCRLNEFLLRNPDKRELYEKLVGGKAWSALRNGIGAPSKTPEPQAKKNGSSSKTPQAKPAQKDPVLLYLLFLVSIGKEALEKDEATNEIIDGDAVISFEIEKLRADSLGDKVQSGTEKGLEGALSFLRGLNKGLGR